jgi:hypothetical protein
MSKEAGVLTRGWRRARQERWREEKPMRRNGQIDDAFESRGRLNATRATENTCGWRLTGVVSIVDIGGDERDSVAGRF